MQHEHRLDLAVVIPTYNERCNVVELIERLDKTLADLRWEAVFVDDDSPDDTAELLRSFAQHDRRIRVIHRVGRRGLSSACIEGILSTTAPCVAVMDADMQHDEAILPSMLQLMRAGSYDVVVGTRNAEGGSMGQFSRNRVRLSQLGRRISEIVCRCQISDPMSGFFMVQRSFFLEVVRELHGGGFKILVDLLASAHGPVRLAEVGYTFRARRHGESKLNASIAVDYLMLVIDKLVGRYVPVRFVAFALVGLAGVATHLVCLALLMFGFHVHFIAAQIAATYVAMTENFFLDNLITWRDRSLRGMRLASGLASFWLACSFGAWANVLVARSLSQTGATWYFAGITGIVLGSVWNYSISNILTWRSGRTSDALTEIEYPANLPG